MAESETPRPRDTEDVVDLWAPCTSDVLLDVRTSRMKKMPGLTIESGIDKASRGGAVRVSRLGLDEDEHDLTFHGGVDKAVHGYCCSHYPSWSTEFPSAASRFGPGGFGENLVTKHMNERNVCIGDIWSVGPPSPSPHDNIGADAASAPVLLQVSLPRQPCFKLNHRFQLKNFAPKTWRTSRTGWYYRVLRAGEIRAGDAITLVERPCPDWTVERVQEYLHRNQGDDAANAALAEIKELGEESRGQFRARVAKAKAKAKREQQKGPNGAEEAERWRDFRVVERRKDETRSGRIAALVLEAVEPLTGEDKEDKFPKGGAHARFLLPNGLVRSYSVVSGDWDRLELGVALEPESRGGSRWLHEVDGVSGSPEAPVVKVGRVTTDVPVAKAASNHVFIVGGVGITAFLALAENYRSINWSVELHYAVRSMDDVPFRGRLEKLGLGQTNGAAAEGDASGLANGAGVTVKIYDKSRGQRMDVDAIVGSLKWNSQLYVCGPTRLMDAAKAAAAAHGIDEDEVHFEAFGAETGGDPFEAEVANRGGKIVKVGEEETLLEALRRDLAHEEGEEDDQVVGSSCEVGNCGTCRISVRDGRVEHRGTALLSEEKQQGLMLSCVSRGIGRIVIDI